MINRYFQDLWALWSDPSGFFSPAQDRLHEKEAFRFANLTALAVALELGLVEILSGSSGINVLLVTGVMLLALPFLVNLGIYLWDGFLRLSAALLGQDLPARTTRLVTAYSIAGLVLVGVGLGIGRFLALSVFAFQVLGLEKALRCSRWTAGVYVLFPLSLMAVLGLMVLFMFKVFQ